MFRLNLDKVQEGGMIIGRGGNGGVYPYGDPQTSNWVVKIIHTISLIHFLRALSEIILGLSCDHFAIVPTVGFNWKQVTFHAEQSQFKIYIKMARMQQNLRTFIGKKRQNLSLKEIVKIFYALASALDYLHQRRIAHRDIKPNNILLDHQNNVFLSDVGSAIRVHEDEKSYTVSIAEGTLQYEPPEIAKFKGKVHKKAFFKGDIWSFGLTLLQLCSLDLKTFSDKEEDKKDQINRMLKQIEVIYNKSLANVLRKLVEWDPEERPFAHDVCKYLKNNFSHLLVNLIDT